LDWGFCLGHMAWDLLKFISKPALNRSLAEAHTDGKWIEDIKGKLSIPALMQFCELWETPNGTFSNKSAYHTLWLVPWQYAEFWCRRNIVSPLPNHLRNRHWTTDRLARRGLQHPQVCPLCAQEPETIHHLMITQW
jgi:hypothetical protein